jgi:glycosyltransferase involved in cell wall biosynthesis
MADRVTRFLPRVGSRVVVRHHPLRLAVPRGCVTGGSAPYILYPSMPSPHKDILGGLRLLTKALANDSGSVRIKVTCTPHDIQGLPDQSLVDPIGPQSLAAMDILWAGASAAFSPYTLESFNYPIAEGRAIGVPVIAVETPQNREVGGCALMGFQLSNVVSLAEAVQEALASTIVPDPLPFDPDAYFEWLINL